VSLSNQMSSDDDKKAFCAEKLAELQKTNPNVLFIIARSKNLNLVVYEALVEEKNKKLLASKKPIDVYWLDVDPAYIAASRKKGIMTDRVDLNFLEKKLAYGVNFEPIKDSSNEYLLKLVALSDRRISLSIEEKTGLPRATITLTDTSGKAAACYLEKVYVSSTEGYIRTTVNFVEIFGVVISTGEKMVERVIPPK